MNRREAIGALMSLPGVAHISVAQIKPEDVIVLESDERMSIETIDRLTKQLKAVWPVQKCIVLDKGLKLKVVSG